jgi:hypothetical protein
MAILPIKEIDMKGHSSMVTQGLEELLYQFEVEGSDPRPFQFHMKNQPGSHREVQGYRG